MPSCEGEPNILDDDFGVRFRAEYDALRREIFTQFVEVLQRSIVHQSDAVVRIQVGVGVPIDLGSTCSPTSMTKSGVYSTVIAEFLLDLREAVLLGYAITRVLRYY